MQSTYLNQCKVCYSGYYKKWDRTCVVCDDANCDTCADSGTGQCQTCKTGYFLTEGNICESCANAGCDSCDGSCKCAADFYFSSNKCIACDEGLSSAAGSVGAKSCKCPADSYLKDGKCVACDQGKSSPTGSTSADACQEGNGSGIFSILGGMYALLMLVIMA